MCPTTPSPLTPHPLTASYRGLPPLAGLGSLEDAMRPGLSVNDCVARLKVWHYAFKRLHHIFIARIPAEPIYELKMAFSHHAYLCAEQVAALRRRVGEMREPPLGLEQVPDQRLAMGFDEILAAPATGALLLGIYGKAVPGLRGALEHHLRETNLLADAPSVRLCRFALVDLGDMLAYGERALACLEASGAAPDGWTELLDACFSGPLRRSEQCDDADDCRRQFSATPYVFDKVPRRDARFTDPYNMGVNAEAFLYNPSLPAWPKVLMMCYKRLREIDVPEMMASIIVETPDKPWAYYLDMSRQLWDEARHAMMGEVGFNALGVDWSALVRVNFTWSLVLNTQLTPLERHAVLYFIEQGLMPRTGKRFEWETATAAGVPLARTMQDYDWADEVLHARIGRDWYVTAMPSQVEALHYGDRCWSKVLVDWQAWKVNGLTEHANWWPALYSAACERLGVAPDPAVLAWTETYETTRADLRDLSAPA
jgi:hypothetical protein